MSFNPYEVLDVPQDATEDEIVAAGKRTAKEKHPDAGGSTEEFVESRRALALLLDPGRRRRFDATGKVEEERTEGQDIVEAQGMIYSVIAKVTDDFVKSEFAAQNDPRRLDFAAFVAHAISETLRQNRVTLAKGKRHAELMRDLMKRFKKRKGTGPNLIRRSIEDHLNQIEERIDVIERAIAINEKALELIATYDFKADPQPTQAMYFVPMGTFFTS